MTVSNSKTLQIFRDGRRHTAKETIQLPPDAAGNLQTLALMAQIVREDSSQKDYRNFVLREFLGFDKSISEQIDAAFEFCRDKIFYEPEKPGFETVADLWSCLYAFDERTAKGDCVVKSVALATMLSFLNLKPVFVAIKQVPNAAYFNHVYVELDGTTLDATPPQFRPGNELKFLQKLIYPIF